MHIKRTRQLKYFSHSLLFSLAVSLNSPANAAEFEVQAVGKGSFEVLRSIAEQANKELVLRVPEKQLKVNISSDTAYSAVRQVAEDAGYAIRYEFDTFTITPASTKASPARSKQVAAKPAAETFSLTLRNTPVQEAFEMIAKRGRINLLVEPDVSGEVSVNLYDVDLKGAINSVARAAGLTVDTNRDGIFISNSKGILTGALTGVPKEVASFKIQYSDVASVEGIMRPYLSEDGNLVSMPARRKIVVHDKPSVIRQLKSLLREVDSQPRQILIEAKILEITLKDEETFGIDWQSTRGDGDFGTLSLADRDSTGMYFNLVGNSLNAYLSALSETGRVRTLSTPKLLVLEDQEAEVIVGDKIGYSVVTTTGSTTTESVEFLESGTILRVKASVDDLDRIMLEVHPEVSTGELVGGLPIQKTTEVTTNLLAESGEEIFIGGLLRRSKTDNVTGVPGLSKVPVVGALFRKTEDNGTRTETVVIMKPRIVDDTRDEIEPLAELLETDDWFYQSLPIISLQSGCVNNYCRD